MIFARKVNKIPEFYMIFARKMPEFYIIIARKIFFPIFFVGGAPPAGRAEPGRQTLLVHLQAEINAPFSVSYLCTFWLCTTTT